MSTEKYYSSSPFTAEEKKQLQSEFIDFGDMLSLTFKVLKHNFKRALFIPFLWQVLVVLIPVFLLFMFGATGSFPISESPALQRPTLSERESLNYQYDYKYPRISNYPRTEMDTTTPIIPYQGEIGIGGLFLTLLPGAAFAAYILTYLLYIRQISLLNNTEDKKVWQNLKKASIACFKTFALYTAAYTLLTLIGYVLVFTMFASFSFNMIFGMLLALASFVCYYIAGIVWQGFMGGSTWLIALEEYDVFAALETSYKMFKPVFWKNILRWLLAVLVYSVTIAVVVVILAVIGAAIGFSQIPALPAIYLMLVTAGVILCAMSVFTAFDYVSFYNIRMLSLAKSDLKNKED